MRILVLHGIEDIHRMAQSVIDLELNLSQYITKADIIFHCYKHPFYPALADLEYDGIIIWSTFLDARHHPETYNRVRENFDFISNSSAVKIALPQDEYCCNELLDQWMVDWNVDYLYTVLYEYKDQLLPKYLKSKGQIRYGYTGYLNQSLIDRSLQLKPFEARPIDVSYRASGVATNLNKLALYKAQIGDHFRREFSTYDLKLDISVKPEDFKSGTGWFDFVEQSKFVLGVNSGSSVRIPDLMMTQEIRDYCVTHKQARYEQIVSLFLKPEYENFFTAISPRNIEAALLGSCQITTNLGSYSNLLHPGEGFISIEPDCSNHKDVFDQMNDAEYVQKIISNSREAILSCNGLRLEQLIHDMVDLIKAGKGVRDHKDLSFIYGKTRHDLFIKKYLYQNNWISWKKNSQTLKLIKRAIGHLE